MDRQRFSLPRGPRPRKLGSPSATAGFARETGLLEAEKKFRHIKGYQEIVLLKERLNPSRIQQNEIRAVEVA